MNDNDLKGISGMITSTATDLDLSATSGITISGTGDIYSSSCVSNSYSWYSSWETESKEEFDLNEIIEQTFDRYGFKIILNTSIYGEENEKRKVSIRGCTVLGSYKYPDSITWYIRSALSDKILELEASDDMYFEKFTVKAILGGYFGDPLLVSKDLPRSYSDEEDSKEILDNITKALDEIITNVMSQRNEYQDFAKLNSIYDLDTSLGVSNTLCNGIGTISLGVQGTTALSNSSLSLNLKYNP
jgi:hypothetical protein